MRQYIVGSVPHTISISAKKSFCCKITTCAPSNPRALWDKYKEYLSQDIVRELQRHNPNTSLNFSLHIYNEALIRLEDQCLSISGKTLCQLGLPAPVRAGFDVFDREKSYDAEKLQNFVATNKPLLIHDQSLAYNAITDLIASENGGLFFLDTPGGTGKTFLINLLLAEIRAKNEIALAVASSGIASTLLEGGRTAHSALKLPLNFAQSEIHICNISKGSGKAKLLQLCKVIVWDECTMAHKKALEALDRTMRDLRGKNQVMGAAVVVLAGDFRQTLPVIQRGTPADELNACLKASFLWDSIEKRTLVTNMRVHLLNDTTADTFAKQLLSIGDGKFPFDPVTGFITFPEDFCNVGPSVEDLIDKVFPNIINNYLNHQWLCERAILAPKNDSVNNINIKIQNTLPASATIYKSIDTVTDKKALE
jgi:ATP-dependent DNA helicase PIF1